MNRSELRTALADRKISEVISADNWGQHSEYTRRDDDSIQCCAIGFIRFKYGTFVAAENVATKINDRLVQALGIGIVTYNDDPKRTWQDVRRLFADCGE